MAKSARSIELIIFDCDGVLVDSEPLAMRVLRKALARLGLEVAEGHAYRDYLGRSLSTVRQSVLDSHGLEFDDDALSRMREELFQLFHDELTATDGLTEALAALPEDVAICVASSSQPERIRVSLQVTGLANYFGERCFSATEVAAGKPAPDLFLYAADQCGVPVEHCLVIEDSPAGIEAARRAGMRVFAYTGGSHAAQADLERTIAALAPDRVFSDMRRLPDLLSESGFAARPRREVASVVAVDVGTGSVRTGVFDADGNELSRSEIPIVVRRSGGDRGEYASTEIWAACCASVREAVAGARIRPQSVAGIGFDATCSLVVLDRNGVPLTVSESGDPTLDTIAWFDHRAHIEAAEVTATAHPVLKYGGGVVSPEMEVPKLMWLKRHLPETWARAGHFFDLADYLTWKSTGQLGRSRSTLTAKWSFLAHEDSGWRKDFYEGLGIGDMFARGRLPERAAPVGSAIGRLSGRAATELGLTPSCVVATGMIDAHAGALGVLGGFAGSRTDLRRHLGLIAGTSSCVVALSAEELHIEGAWGPYYGAVLPGLWLNEAGQSATGALLDHIIRWHSAGNEPTQGEHDRIVCRIGELRAAEGQAFARRLHVLPDFHGNRSPLAEPRALGVISGLDLDASFDSLCRLYWRSAVGIALGLRHILDTLKAEGFGIDTLHVTGGHTRNPLLMELYSDATGCRVVAMEHDDGVLRGTAMAAAAAAGVHEGLVANCLAMQGSFAVRVPDPARTAEYDREYAISLQMQADRRRIERMGSESPTEPLTARAASAPSGYGTR